ncbi:unnamed protein product [Malus baccata var. baccata]
MLVEIMDARATILFSHDLGLTHLVVYGDAMMVINALQKDATTPCNVYSELEGHIWSTGDEQDCTLACEIGLNVGCSGFLD